MLKIFWGPARKNVKSTKVIALTVTCPSRYLLVQSQQRKDQNNVWNMFKGNMCGPILHCSGATTVDYEKVNAGWVRWTGSALVQILFQSQK